MTGATVGSLAGGWIGPANPLGAPVAIGPSTLADASRPVVAFAAFALVLAVGGLLLWRFEPVVDRSIAASIDRPLSSLAYGLAAHAAIALGGLYLTYWLGRAEFVGVNVGAVGVLAGLLPVLLAASLGFTVVGSTVVELGWERRLRYGLLVGALVAGVAGFLGPVPGGILWFVVVSMGIGGPARRWLHADAAGDV